MSRPIEAIPTVYRGVQMRSRAEADMARLLDLLKMPWQYEATSVVLPNGMHYRPDFVLARSASDDRPTWIEVRGYATPESVAQVQAALRAVAYGQLPCGQMFVVSGDAFTGPLNAAGHYTGVASTFTSVATYQWLLGICKRCKRSRLVLPSIAFGYWCAGCGDRRGAYCLVGIDDGYVSIGNQYLWHEQRLRVRDIADGADLLALLPSPEDDE